MIEAGIVGVVTTSYPRDTDDCAGAFVADRVRALVANGERVEIVAAGDRDQPGAAVADGATVWRVATPGDLFFGAGAPEVLDRGGARAWLSALAFSAAFTSAVTARAARWARVESHWLVPASLVVAGLPRRPHRAHAHGGDVALLERLPGGDSLARALIRSGADLVFASADLARRFARRAGTAVAALGDRILVEAVPVDGTCFLPVTPPERAALRARLGLRGPVVLGVGRLVPIKGFDVLVRAVGRLPRARRPALVLVGEGPERPHLLALARALGVDLRLTGTLPRTQVAGWMHAADVYVQPSRVLTSGRGEGMPVAVREALATGLSAIVAASGGLPDLAARSPDVAVVPPDDPPALSVQLRLHMAAWCYM